MTAVCALIIGLQERIYHHFVDQRGGITRQAAADLIPRVDRATPCRLRLTAPGTATYAIDHHPRTADALVRAALTELIGLGATGNQVAARMTAMGLFGTPADRRTRRVAS